MVSRYRPPIPEALLGAQKTAVAEWKTEIPVTSFVVGQRGRGGGSDELRVLFVEEKMSDEIIKVQLADVRPKCLE